MRALPPLIDVTFVRGVAGEPPWTAHVLDAGELARWTGLHATGRPLFLAAHLGVRLLAARRASVDGGGDGQAPSIGAFGWATLPSGKPLLTLRDGSPQPLHVSVAHGGGLALAAVCEHGPIGVDIEHVDTRRNLAAIARRFFAAEESAQLETCSNDERSLLFHQWWTRKEAVLKATGHGLRGGLAVRVDAPADRDGWRPVTLQGHDAPLFVRDLRTPDAGVVGAVAIEGQAGVVQMVNTTVEERCP